MSQEEERLTPDEPRGRITIGRGGWVLYEDPDLKADIRLRLSRDRNGRLKVLSMHVEAKAGIDGTLLRDIPLGKILARLRAAGNADLWIMWASEQEGEDLAARVRDLDAQLVMPVDKELIAEAADLAKLEDLHRRFPGRAKRPDEFYETVGRVFTRLAATTRNPAGTIADRLHAERTTVHRWVKEARRRGLLDSDATDQGPVE